MSGGKPKRYSMSNPMVQLQDETYCNTTIKVRRVRVKMSDQLKKRFSLKVLSVSQYESAPELGP